MKPTFGNLAGRQPLGFKTGKVKNKPRREKQGKVDREYLARVRDLPCVICETFGEPQHSPTTAHHPIMGRGSQDKASDRDAIPLCDEHHQGQWLNGKIAIHREPAAWREAYGPDTLYIKLTQALLA